MEGLLWRLPDLHTHDRVIFSLKERFTGVLFYSTRAVKKPWSIKQTNEEVQAGYRTSSKYDRVGIPWKCFKGPKQCIECKKSASNKSNEASQGSKIKPGCSKQQHTLDHADDLSQLHLAPL